MDNATLQADEIEALSSIYGNDLIKEDSGMSDVQLYSMIVRNETNTVELRLFVKITPDYPSLEPPTFEISSPYLDGEAKSILSNRLQEIYTENLGQSILHLWFECAQRFLNESRDSEDNDDRRKIDLSIDRDQSISNSVFDIDPTSIKSGDPLTDRKSTFQAHLAPVSTKENVRNILSYLKSNPKISKATHNMYAYRICDEKKRISVQDCEDDGEQQAGSRLLHLLEMIEAKNVLIVVTRWYGGVHLGPDRFKHISNLARDLLEKNGYTKETKKVDKKK